jgi:hypothetical protein
MTEINLALIAMFKNEAHIMKEWIEHYIKEGVEKFYMIDNGSTDNYMTIIAPYIKKKYVIVIKDRKRYAQMELYNKYFLNIAKKTKWCIVCDLDEFIYSRNGYNRIIDYLNSVPNDVSNVLIPWKLFGSNGYIKQPSSVIKSFTKRQNANIDSIEIKPIFRGRSLKKIGVHNSEIDGRTINSANDPIENKYSSDTSEDILKRSNLHLNHYAIQSYNWFKSVKMTRGDACSSQSDRSRNDEYFLKYDHKDLDDYELANKKY